MKTNLSEKLQNVILNLFQNLIYLVINYDVKLKQVQFDEI